MDSFPPSSQRLQALLQANNADGSAGSSTFFMEGASQVDADVVRPHVATTPAMAPAPSTAAWEAMASKLDVLTDIVSQTRASQMALLKKSGHEPEFKKKGNRVQHQFNSSVLATLEEAWHHVVTNRVAEAADSLAQGMSALEKRNKLILLADSTELGWDVVAAYETQDIADDEEDDKKMSGSGYRESR